MKLLFLSVLIFAGFHFDLSGQDRPFITLRSGMKIESGAFVNPLEYHCYDSAWQTIIITGENFTLDFSGATLWGASDTASPDEYHGVAVIIKDARNIRINNLRIHRFHTAIYIENSDGIYINNCDLSYNYRPRLHSYREFEMLSDWLSYHSNESREWKDLGASIFATNLNNSTFESIRITGGLNGILLDKSNGNKIFNSAIHFNSGVGIGLYRSSGNIIQHNRLDYNVRGVSHKFYRRGQDSAGVLLFEQCNNNTVAYNSITHSGDGIFLWAGQETMDKGTGGSNGNMFYGNDCSFSPTNGIEVTFSSNNIIGNKLNGCIHGIWGGYSFNSTISDNEIHNNKVGIAIEHGYNNNILNNNFSSNETAVKLWKNEDNQNIPWVAFNDLHPDQNEFYEIKSNQFESDRVSIDLQKGKKFDIQFNEFRNIPHVVKTHKVNKCNLKLKKNGMDAISIQSLTSQQKRKNYLLKTEPPATEQNIHPLKPDKLDEGYDVSFPMYPWNGIPSIIMTEWGPYDFRYPYIHLADIKDSVYTFVVFGPAGSQWNINQVQGLHSINKLKGNYQDTIIAIRRTQISQVSISAIHQGSFFFDQTGNLIPANDTFNFNFVRTEAIENWITHCYLPVDSLISEDILQGNMSNLEQVQTFESNHLHKDWWSLQYEKGGQKVKTNNFISLSEGKINIHPGKYNLELYLTGRSRVYLNDEIVYDGSAADPNKPFLIPVELQQNPNKIVIVNAGKSGIASIHCRLLAR